MESPLEKHVKKYDTSAQRALEAAILADPTYGPDKNARKAKLNLARKTSTTLIIIGAVFPFWFTIYLQPYDLAMWLALVYPLVLIAVVFAFKGLITISSSTGIGTVLPGILTSGGTLAGTVLSDFSFEFNSTFWIATAASAVLLWTIAHIGSRELSASRFPTSGYAFLSAVLFFACTFGDFIFINCRYDNTSPARYPAMVVYKKIDTEKTTTYHIKLSSWKSDARDYFSISKERFNSTNPGDSVVVVDHKGRLGSPWVTLDFKDQPSGTED